MKKMMIPKNLKIDNLIGRYSTNKIEGFHLDKVYFICFSIYQMMMYLDEHQKYPGKDKCYYVPLQASILKKHLGNKYTKIVNWMKKAGIIQTDKSWQNSVTSKGFRLTDKYLGSGKKWVTVTYEPFLKRKKRIERINNWPLEKRVVGMLQKWFDTGALKIDVAAADNELKKYKQQELDAQKKANRIKVQVRYMSRMSAVYSLSEKRYNIVQDSYGYRVHTPLTQLKKELRCFVTYNNEKLVQLDIKNSQLFFMCYLLNEDNWKIKGANREKKSNIWKSINSHREGQNNTISNTIMFPDSAKSLTGECFQKNEFVKNACEGSLYESIVSAYYNAQDEVIGRKEVKQVLLGQIFCNPDRDKYFFFGKNSRTWECFQTLYPDVATIIDTIKRHNHKYMSMLLQRIESTAMLSYVCKNIQKHNKDIPLFTIHDCLVTTINHKMTVEALMINSIEEFTGLKPTLDITYWSSEQLNNEELNKAA
ncbi:MAG: hypothetical protein JNK00_10785 [Flavipsychrobacter sp.]|nr:hypothetical protein [Flavipsychrobacter sp.]